MAQVAGFDAPPGAFSRPAHVPVWPAAAGAGLQARPSEPSGFSSPFGAAAAAVREVAVPVEPQIFVVDDCIVLIPRPVEFYRKKNDIIRSGSQSLQVFADFERTFTTFRAPNGEVSYGTSELMETSSALLPQAAARIKALLQEFEGPADLDDGAVEEVASKVQDIISKEGGLHMSYISPATRDMRDRISLRNGWKETLNALSSRRVPTYIFSGGYGDVIMQLLVQNGLAGGHLQPNIRLISNFFRAAPDGSVRGFSRPIVHQKNKNATTASRQMDMPLPERPYALVITSEEGDAKMAADAPGVKELLSVGYLEMTTELPNRFPGFAASFDAIVLGDGSFRFCRSLVEDLLQTTPPAAAARSAGGDESYASRVAKKEFL